MAISSPSSVSTFSSSSQRSLEYIPPPSPAASSSNSASSSKISFTTADDENVTITSSNRTMSKTLGKQKSNEDLLVLAVSTHMTELSYSISDIQTRIFEIQELRHKSQSSSGDTAGTTSIIDQSLMNLDERLESVGKGMKSIADALDPLQASSAPTLASNGQNAMILRKHAALVAEWEAVQDESDVLREELKEDKWLTVFRTVTDQADGMMSSLEKAVNRCQDFIWQVHRLGLDNPSQSQSSLSASQRSDKSPVLSFDVFNSLLDSFEAKKKHYMPATSKVLSIIDKGVQDRVTKNGETLRRHAESAQRWKNLRERISRTDVEMETVRKILLSLDAPPSENGSSTSGVSTRNGYLATPTDGRSARTPSGSSTALSRSISPFRKFARKITGNTKAPPVTPLVVKNKTSRTPSSEPVPPLRRQRTSIFAFRGSQPPTPSTPERPVHKYSQSLTPDSSPQALHVDTNSTIKNRTPNNKQRWNSSTKVENEERSGTVKGTPPRRAPSSAGMYDGAPPVPSVSSTYRRSLSRSSMASGRPWSPISSSISTNQSSHPPMPIFRPPSRAQTPSRAITPGLGLSSTPRPRPKTPSHIPAPAKMRSISGSQSESSFEDGENSSLMQRAFSPSYSVSGLSNSNSPKGGHPPRPPSRSMIPVPSLHLSSPSRPGSAMSQYARSESPTTSSFRSSANRAQTPEFALRARAQQVPFYQGGPSSTPTTNPRTSGRPSLQKLPPSSFKDGGSRAPSRPGSRNGAYTPTMDQQPVYEYVPSNPKDPLDAEVALVVNSVAHGLLVERVDPPLRKIPREGEEIRAQYAFSNALAKKIVTCRLTTLTRSGRAANGDPTSKKVMCRVGGGWQDLQLYMLNRQAGL